MTLSSTMIAEFDTEYDGCPAKKFVNAIEAQRFMDDLWGMDVSYRSKVVRPKRNPAHVMVMYVGPTDEFQMGMN